MLDVLAHDTNVWVLISFVIFLFIVMKAGKGAVAGMLDARIEKIKADLENAENLHVEAQELLAQYQRKHKNAVKEAEKIIANAEEYAAQIRKQANAELKETMGRKEKQLAERLERMKDAAIADIQSYAAEISIDATREIILKEFSKKDDQALLDEEIKKVSSSLH
jgi:F-type H+-transporting ATPase subunit b